MSDERLKSELETYLRLKDSLLAHEGKYALIHGSELDSIWDTYEDALKVGYEKFVLNPFLVKQIKSAEQLQYFTRELCRP